VANNAFEAVVTALAYAGLPHQTTTDGEVAQGLENLTEPAAIILPYNRALSPAELNLLEAAVHQGVALLVFYLAPEQLAERLGVQLVGHEKVGADQQLILRSDTANLPGIPASLALSSPFRSLFTVLQGQANTAAWWQLSGDEVEAPRALVLNQAGAFFGFLPRSADVPGLASVLWAVLGRVTPEMVSAALPRNLKQLGPVGPYLSLGEMMEAWRESEHGAEPQAWEYAKQAESLVWQINDLVTRGDFTQAIAQVTQARDLAQRAYWASFSSRCPEIRGVWAYPWSQPDWESTMARLAAANFNVVFPYVCSAGVAYYPSSVLPRSTQYDQDYLAQACAAAQRHGLALHPRLLALQCLFSSAETKASVAEQGRLMVNSQGETMDWLCPSDPRNYEQLLVVATEIVMRYPVQGIQLDYFRYPTTDACLCPRCRLQFERDTSVRISQWPQDVLTGSHQGRFLQWRKELLTDLLRALRAQLRALRPEVQLSVAVYPDWSRHQRLVGQDPITWADKGLVDFICPMNYTADLRRFDSLVQYQLQGLGGQVSLAAGIGAFSDACQFERPQDLANQILVTRKRGAAGFVIFNYNPRFAEDFLPWIELGLTSRSCSPAG